MKILVLNGSPKREKSDTMHITRAFLEGMQEAAPQVIRTIDVIDRHIEYCTGCFACKMNGGTCMHQDDMQDILHTILESDLLLFSFPLYCYGMPAPLKTLLDRTMPLSSMAMQKVGDRYAHVGQADFSRLRYLMICGCGFPNSRHNFEPAVAQFKLCFPENHTILTIPESPMFSALEAAAVTEPRLALVRQAGKQYALAGSIDEALLSQIGSPMIPEEQYAAIVNGLGSMQSVDLESMNTHKAAEPNARHAAHGLGSTQSVDLQSMSSQKAVVPNTQHGVHESGSTQSVDLPEMRNTNRNTQDATKDKGEYRYLSLRECPELLNSAAAWFHEKWGVPRKTYAACMMAYLNRETEYGWYLCLNGNRIVGGLGVIENDFHDRKDLTPNVCAVYTEEAFRGHGVAGHLLGLVVQEMRAKGIMPLYLVTDHTGFYERYGWEFLCTAKDDSGNASRVYIYR